MDNNIAIDIIKEELNDMLQRWKDIVKDAPPSGHNPGFDQMMKDLHQDMKARPEPPRDQLKLQTSRKKSLPIRKTMGTGKDL